MIRKLSPLIPTIILAFFVSGCEADQGIIQPAYIPPTHNQNPSAVIPTPKQQEMMQTEIACTNNLLWLEDLTVPDGSIFSSGEDIDKRWLISNTGSCNWDHRYRLVLIAGSHLNASPEQALFPARAGSTATIQMIFSAPAEPGSYSSVWQATDPQGQAFGDPIYMEIIVQP